MVDLVANAILKYDLLKSGDRVIIALSGGADSAALLHIFYSIKEKYNLTLYAAHVNHGLRGEAAKQDENFCKSLCKKYKIELFVKITDVGLLAKQQKISEELCGRNVRYAFFEELSEKLDAKIATAHTASDNAETLIFNIIRGSSVSGICAIPPRRGKIIRPLIDVTRQQVEQYCAENSLQYVTDATNFEEDYTRNKIRLKIIPLIKEINPNFETAAGRLSRSSREVTQYLDSQARKALKSCKTEFGYDRKALLNLDTAVLKKAILIICTQSGADDIENKHIELMLKTLKSGGAVNLKNGFTAISKQNVFRVINSSKTQAKENAISFRLKENLNFTFNGKNYFVEKTGLNSKTEFKNLINADLCLENAVFRTRQSGDKFTFPYRKITKPLRKVMNEMKIPCEEREKILVLAIDSTVLWCENIGVSLQGCCSDTSTAAIKINVKRKWGINDA